MPSSVSVPSSRAPRRRRAARSGGSRLAEPSRGTLHDPLVLAVEEFLQRAQPRERHQRLALPLDQKIELRRDVAKRVPLDRAAGEDRAERQSKGEGKEGDERDRGEQPRPQRPQLHGRRPCSRSPSRCGSSRAGRACGGAARHGRRPCACRPRSSCPRRGRAADRVRRRCPRSRAGRRAGRTPCPSARRSRRRRAPRGPADRPRRRRARAARPRGRARAPEHGLHTCGQLAGRERLRDVVVGADLEAGDAVDLLVACGQHQHRHVRARADAAADVEAVRSRKADVEDDEPRAQLLERSSASSPERTQATR